MMSDRHKRRGRGALSISLALACSPKPGAPTSGSSSGTQGVTSGTSGTSVAASGPTATSVAASDSSAATGASDPTTGGTGSCRSGWCAAKDFVNVLVADDHPTPHELVIPGSDAAACEAHSYAMMGAADHDHTFTLSADEFQLLNMGGQVEHPSSEAQGHTHLVWTDCE